MTIALFASLVHKFDNRKEIQHSSTQKLGGFSQKICWPWAVALFRGWFLGIFSSMQVHVVAGVRAKQNEKKFSSPRILISWAAIGCHPVCQLPSSG
jgi:hypothetical protein